MIGKVNMHNVRDFAWDHYEKSCTASEAGTFYKNAAYKETKAYLCMAVWFPEIFLKGLTGCFVLENWVPSGQPRGQPKQGWWVRVQRQKESVMCATNPWALPMSAYPLGG